MKSVERLTLLLIALAAAAPASADTGERGSVPPGQSVDGSRPSEGAIVGGSPDLNGAASVTEPNAREVERCKQLQGSLREQCLRDLEGKAPMGESTRGSLPPDAQNRPGRDPSHPR